MSLPPGHVLVEVEEDGLLPVTTNRADHHHLHLVARPVDRVVRRVVRDARVDGDLVEGQHHEPLVGRHAVLDGAHDLQRHLQETGGRPEAPRPSAERGHARQREPEPVSQQLVAPAGRAPDDQGADDVLLLPVDPAPRPQAGQLPLGEDAPERALQLGDGVLSVREAGAQLLLLRPPATLFGAVTSPLAAQLRRQLALLRPQGGAAALTDREVALPQAAVERSPHRWCAAK